MFFLLFGIILPFAYFILYFSYFWNFRFPPNYLSTRWFNLDPKALVKTGVIGRANPLAEPDHFHRFTWYRPDPSMRPRQCFDFESLTNFPLQICPTVSLAGSLSSKIILKSPRSTASCLKALTLSSFSFLFTVPFKAATFAVANHQVWRFPILHRASASKISRTILERVSNGSLLVWGEVGKVNPLHLVMPITVEFNKPRMCHDERFLNCWIKDCPFTLDYISDLPRYVLHGLFQTFFDDKSGYDHVRLRPSSSTFFRPRTGKKNENKKQKKAKIYGDNMETTNFFTTKRDSFMVDTVV